MKDKEFHKLQILGMKNDYFRIEEGGLPSNRGSLSMAALSKHACI